MQTLLEKNVVMTLLGVMMTRTMSCACVRPLSATKCSSPCGPPNTPPQTPPGPPPDLKHDTEQQPEDPGDLSSLRNQDQIYLNAR